MSGRTALGWTVAGRVVIGLLAGSALAGCAGATSMASPRMSIDASPPAPTATSSVSPSAPVTPAASAPSAGPSSIGDGPPAATMAVDGGDPVTGQLGTYRWADGGSDSPWLHGAPIAVGHGETLTMAFQPAIDIAAWRARRVPAGADDPAGATSLGDGHGSPTIVAPASGRWTVEIAVSFADDAGSASYFWELAVDP